MTGHRRSSSAPTQCSLLLALAIVVAACGGGGEPAAPVPVPFTPVVTTVEVSPGTAALVLDQTVRLSVTVKDQKGGTLSGRVPAWTTSSAAVATVASDGLVSAVGAGSATITAAVEGKQGSATITVTSPVASVSLARDTATLTANATLQLSATIKDARGATLSGRAIAWTSSAATVATVSTGGLVTALNAGRTFVVVSSEGKSDTATISVQPGPVQLSTRSGASSSATIGPAGGSITAAGAGGVQYTLTVPLLALSEPIEITVTPLDAVAGLPLSGGFAAGVDFAPSGLRFAKAATLKIATTAQPGTNQRLVGFSYQGAGTSLALAPSQRASGVITIPVLHFSGVGVGFGSAQDVEALFFGINPPPGSAAYYVNTLIRASVTTPRDPAFELQVVEDWFDDVVRPALDAATTDAQLVAALGAREDWENTPDLIGTFGVIPGGATAPTLASRRAAWVQGLIPKLNAAIDGNLQLCAAPGLSSARLTALDNAIFWHRMARIGFGVDSAKYGLDLQSFQSKLCARSVSENISLADPLKSGSNTLDITFKLVFTGGQLVIPANFFVTSSAIGASLALPSATALAQPGFLTGSVIPIGTITPVTVDLTACYAGNSRALSLALDTYIDELCHQEQLVRQRPAVSFEGQYRMSYRVTNLKTGTLTQSAADYFFFRNPGSSDYCFQGTHLGRTCGQFNHLGPLTGSTWTSTSPLECDAVAHTHSVIMLTFDGQGSSISVSGNELCPGTRLTEYTGVWTKP